MRVLYCTNIPAPYRVAFFELLGTKCDLTVMYENAMASKYRDSRWVDANHARSYHEIFLGHTAGDANRLPLRGITRQTLSKDYDIVIVGCYNSIDGIAEQMTLQGHRHPYLLNIDGEYFVGRQGFKRSFRDRLVGGASGYLIAGEQTGAALKMLVRPKGVWPYHFSSLTEDEVHINSEVNLRRGSFVLCVGQYRDYKGIDVLVDVAERMPGQPFKIIGVAGEADCLKLELVRRGIENIEVVSYMSRQELAREYSSCACLVLPSRQECWGLVVNEASSFGTPIVSTSGSGAALEFLAEEYSQFLALPGSVDDLFAKLSSCLAMPGPEKESYSSYLREKSSLYTIEVMVKESIDAILDFMK